MSLWNTWISKQVIQLYLADRKQFASINGFVLSISSITCGVPQGSVLLFLLYTNDIHVVMKHCKVYHFADDTYVLIINKSLKRLNKLLNWLNATKFH